LSLLWRLRRRRGDVDRARSLMAACGHQSPQHTAFLLTHSTNAVARSECPTTKRLPLPLAYSLRKISAKRGIMKSLEILYRWKRTTTIYRERDITLALAICLDFSNVIDTANVANIVKTVNIANIANAVNMYRRNTRAL
jgi:hypothetical protein